MALKRQHETLSMFSMASMTDVIFLLLIFFLVTSTFVFPSALEVNLPQSSQQTAIKPTTRLFIKEDGKIYAQQNTEATQGEPKELAAEQIKGFMQAVKDSDPSQYIALHADESVPYGKIVEILDMGSQVGIKVVLATKPASNNYSETTDADQAAAQPQEAAQDNSASTTSSTTTVTTTTGNDNVNNNTTNAAPPKTTVIEQ